jgi:hypothetical protein
MSSTYTSSSTYTTADIEKVLTRFLTDMLMIADTTKAITQDKARSYARDIERLAKKGYLQKVDLTLLDAWGAEQRAVVYDIDTDAGGLTSSRPGGVLWPHTPNGSVRIIVWYTDAYDSDAREKMKDVLEVPWGPTSVNTSHSTLQGSAGRNYESNGFGMQRKDFTK